MDQRLAVELMDTAWMQRQVKCRAACPVNTNAAGYISLIAQGRFAEAYEMAKEPNPFVSVCAHICAHPCETFCRRGLFDEPIGICALKRFAYDNRGQRRPIPPITPREEKAAVIGAGPAGFSCAHDLALKGYRITIFEAQPVPGGQMRLGLPPYRLPRNVIDEDIGEILKIGVEVRYNQRCGRDFTLQDLKDQGYRAVFLAVGACKSRDLPLPGTDLDGAHKGVEFLTQVNLGQRVNLGKRCIVIGGGNVAMDVARSAWRQGASEVHIVCLESRDEMPASDFEVHEAQEEGITINHRLGPREILGRDGRVSGLRLVGVKSVFDANRRFNPIFDEDRIEEIECDSVILAVGQTSDLSFLRPADGVEVTPRNTIKIDPRTMATTAPGIFAGGDAAFGPAILIDAVGDGRRAARSIHQYLSGQDLQTEIVQTMTKVDWYRGLDDYDRRSRPEMPALPPEQRDLETEVELGYDLERAQAEACRCLHCFINPWLNPDDCIVCGGCVDVCPHDCLSIVNLARLGDNPRVAGAVAAGLGEASEAAGGASVMLKDEDLCIRCGLCAHRCPTGAMSMQRFDWSEKPKAEAR